MKSEFIFTKGNKILQLFNWENDFYENENGNAITVNENCDKVMISLFRNIDDFDVKYMRFQ